jgi:hypothetical protein
MKPRTPNVISKLDAVAEERLDRALDATSEQLDDTQPSTPIQP